MTFPGGRGLFKGLPLSLRECVDVRLCAEVFIEIGTRNLLCGLMDFMDPKMREMLGDSLGQTFGPTLLI